MTALPPLLFGAFDVTDPAGPTARSIAALWWFMLILGTISFAIFMVALIVGIRRRHDGIEDDGPPPLEAPPESAGARRWMTFGGLVLPSIAIVGCFVGMVIVLPNTDPRRAEPTVTIDVTGHQWWWEVRYPGDDVVTANEIHIPVDQPVLINLRSADVIHSFWVPALAGKTDALPDRPNALLLEADQTGRFEGRCAEFCGLRHARMAVAVIVEEQAEFDAWLAANAVTPGGATSSVTGAGQTLYAQDCAQCHVLDGSESAVLTAPDLPTFPQRRLIGGVLENTPENLRTWIAEPHAYKEGKLMPEVELSAEDIAAVADYVEGLHP